ncbi:hypothetical protein AB0N62_36810 [Streptomyces sp. NPDC093982]|uniref:hypothetical protein n=1 Tax=Streptomyces sp. NPDC093982 TaxID=3155077 RepID=UPI00343A3E46
MIRKLITLVVSLTVAPLLIFAQSATAEIAPLTDNMRVVLVPPTGGNGWDVVLKFEKNGTGAFKIQTTTSVASYEWSADPKYNACIWPAYCATHEVYAAGGDYPLSFFLTPVQRRYGASGSVTTANKYSLRVAANVGPYEGRGYCLTSKDTAKPGSGWGLFTCGDNSYSTASQEWTIKAADPSKQAKINQYMLQAGLNVCETTSMATCTYSKVAAGAQKWGTPVQARDSWLNNTASTATATKTVSWTSESSAETRTIKSTTSGWSINAEIGGTVGPPKDSWWSASAKVAGGISNTVHNETQTAVTVTQRYMSTTSLLVPGGDIGWIAVRPLVVPITTTIDIAYYPTNYEGGRQTDNNWGSGSHAAYHVDSFALDVPIKADDLGGTYHREIACFKSTMSTHPNCQATFNP